MSNGNFKVVMKTWASVGEMQANSMWLIIKKIREMIPNLLIVSGLSQESIIPKLVSKYQCQFNNKLWSRNKYSLPKAFDFSNLVSMLLPLWYLQRRETCMRAKDTPHKLYLSNHEIELDKVKIRNFIIERWKLYELNTPHHLYQWTHIA